METQLPLSTSEMEAKVEALEDFKRWGLMEEMTWRQKSREIWLKEGDKNTGFFHRMVSSHRRQSHIKRLRINGCWYAEDRSMRKDIANTFQVLSNPGEWRASLEGLNFSRINEMEASRLELPFSEEEVHAALCDMNGDKAPRSDGFIAAFWLKS